MPTDLFQPFPGPHGTVANPDGSFSSERTTTFEIDGKHYIAPTLVFDTGPAGTQLTPQQAIDRAVRLGLDKFPSFGSQTEADTYARSRTTAKSNAMANNTTDPNKPLTLADLYAIFGAMSGGGGLFGYGGASPMGAAQTPPPPTPQDVPAPPAAPQLNQFHQIFGTLPGAQGYAPSGGNVHFTGGSPFEVNPWPSRISNILGTVGLMMQQIQKRKVAEAAKAKAQGASNGG